MNRSPFEAFAVDVPALISALGMPARAERNGTAEGALAELAALRPRVEAGLSQVRTVLRVATPHVDGDVVARMEGLLADGLKSGLDAPRAPPAPAAWRG